MLFHGKIWVISLTGWFLGQWDNIHLEKHDSEDSARYTATFFLNLQ